MEDLLKLNNTNIVEEKNLARRDFVLLAAQTMLGLGCAISSWPFLYSLYPSRSKLSEDFIDVDLSQIKLGEVKTIMWQNKPIFIRHRTKQEVAEAQTANLNELPDPEPDEQRVKKGYEQWLVAIGICSHLGCLPLAYKGDYHGWLCPCHGAQYDVSGRVRKGPALKNLYIPSYEFINDRLIRIS